MTVSPARVSALRVVSRVRHDAAFSGAVLAAELRGARLTDEDAALATRLAYGTLAAEGVLDETIDRFARGALEPRVRDCLRLGTYELLFARTPPYAVVDQTVTAVRAVRTQAAPLANAVMRKIADVADDFPFGDPERDFDALARATAHPRWLVDLFVASLGEPAAREALSGGAESAPTFVRIDPFAARPAETRAQLEAAGAGPTPYPPDVDCFALSAPCAAFRTTGPEGYFGMDAAAQFAPTAAQPSPEALVMDIGAGRGNKTICLQALAVRQGAPARIVAVDRHEGKSQGLRERLRASGVPGVEVVVADATDLASVEGFGTYDVALLDAPCTGLGTLRRYPEKRWRITPEDVSRMAGHQLALLAAATAVVRPGGRVVYSTCSVAAAENGDVVGAFLRDTSGGAFAIEPVGELVPPEWDRYVDPSGCFQSWPSPGGPDGHYVARLRHVGARESKPSI